MNMNKRINSTVELFMNQIRLFVKESGLYSAPIFTREVTLIMKTNMSTRRRKLSKHRQISSSSDEDEDSGPSRRKLSSASQKKKKHVTALVETDSDTDHTEDSGVQTESRSSERLNKRNSRSFQMPSRDSIWNNIPSTPTSTNKTIYRLKPRRVVKSFTRITHRYNQDVCYSEEDDSDTNDFIASDGTVSDSEDESNVPDSEGEYSNGNRKTHHQKEQGGVVGGRHHRIKGYRPKILDTAGMSSESEAEGKTAGVTHISDSTGQVMCDGHEDTHSGVENYKQSVETLRESRSKSRRKKRRQSLIVSSSDSDHSTGTSDEELQHCGGSETGNHNTNECGGTETGTGNHETGVETKCHNSMEMTVESSKKLGTDQTLSKSPVAACGTGTHKPEIGSGLKSGADSSSDHESDDSSNSGGSVSDSTRKSDNSCSDSDHDAQLDFENIKSTRARHQIQKQESAKKKKFEAFLEARRKVNSSKRN